MTVRGRVEREEVALFQVVRRSSERKRSRAEMTTGWRVGPSVL
jgi:hypothetical protein